MARRSTPSTPSSAAAAPAATAGRREIDHRTHSGARLRRSLQAARLQAARRVLPAADPHGAQRRLHPRRPVALDRHQPDPQAEPPPQPPPDPQPPYAEPSGPAIVEEAWGDPDWGMLVWLAMTTGARRGELCALRWNRIDFATGVIDIRSSIAQVKTRTVGEGHQDPPASTHRRRRPDACAAASRTSSAWLRRQHDSAIELAEDAFVFSPAPDHRTLAQPDTVTQRYSRMCKRLGWDMHIHQLRHFSATELIAAGVDIRTVAGRLGHGGGGTTTLRVYSAWVAEADQRAATSLAARLPALPGAMPIDNVEATPLPSGGPVTRSESPYQWIADDLRAAIRCGAIKLGEHLPTVKELADHYSVSEGTAHRGVALLAKAGEIEVSRGRRAVVVKRPG